MSIEVMSTTDSAELVQAANKPPETKTTETATDNKSASASETEKVAAPADETTEASDALENENDDSDESSEEETKPDKNKKPTTGFQKKINKLTKKNYELLRELETLRTQKPITPAVQDTQQVDKANEKPAVSADGKPDPNTFETWDKYLDALADWKIDQREKLTETKRKESELKAERQKTIDSHMTRVNEFKKAHLDFDDMLESVEHIPFPASMQTAVMDSELGPELMYELAKNPSELERIGKLSYTGVMKEIGKLEAKISSQKEPSAQTTTPAKTITKAPPPITPVGNKGSTKKYDINDPDIPFKEFERLRREQERKAKAY